MTVRWGVAGPGPVAARVLADLAHVPDAVLTAVGSRSAGRAAAFAAAHAAAVGRGPVPAAYGSYRALLADPDVDVVYIATPHPQHRALALAALTAGKAVLVEKSFTVTPAATREVVAAARAAGRSALLFASLRSPAPGEARVLGTRGWIQVPPRFHYPSRIVLHRLGHEPETIDAPLTGAGYAHELAEVTGCIAGGRTESEIMPLADTVAVQDVLAEIASQLGIRVIEGPAELP